MAVNWSLLFPYKLGACRRLLFAYWLILRSRCAPILWQHDVYVLCIPTACSVYTAASIFVGTNFIRDVLRLKRVTLDMRKLIMLSGSFALVSPPFIRKIYNSYLYLCWFAMFSVRFCGIYPQAFVEIFPLPRFQRMEKTGAFPTSLSQYLAMTIVKLFTMFQSRFSKNIKFPIFKQQLESKSNYVSLLAQPDNFKENIL